MALEKTLRVVLDIKVVPVSDEVLAEGNEGLPADAQMTPEDAIDDADAFELAEAVQGMFQDETIKEAFAGSNIYVTFGSQPYIVEAEFLED